MSQIVMGNALWHLIMQSDIMSKGVLLLLLALSIISWSLFIYKWIILRRKRNDLIMVAQQLEKVTTFQDLLSLSFRMNDSFGGKFITKLLSYLKAILETAKLNGRTALTHEERELLREQAYQLADDIMAQEEVHLPFLSATAAVAPLLGLFGTVWGLVHAFISISQKQSADIATVAPGIAEALITTLAGLVVAIPALVMFVFLNNYVKNIDQRLINLADRVIMTANRLMHQ